VPPVAYDPLPCYPPVGGAVGQDWHEPARQLTAGQVLAVDGPGILDWAGVVTALSSVLPPGTTFVPTADRFVAWDQLVKRTAPVDALRDDPDFATLPSATLSDLFDELPAPDVSTGAVAVVFGPGAALVYHDVLWYLDLPKRYAEAAVSAGTVRNLGQPEAAGPATTRRLFYIDWPLLDRHRHELAPAIDAYFDLQAGAAAPTWLAGDALRATARALATRPFRTRPTFNTTSWGGHWAQQQLGFNPEARNTALGYELIAPESGVLVGEGGRSVEVPFDLVVHLAPEAVLGRSVYERFGPSFPVRFDYLDTVAGGNLSVHCHPSEERMRSVFGWPYTQHETYYVMVGDPANVIYLGLRGDAALDEFHERAHAADAHGVPFDIEEYVQTFPAQPHQLFLVPAGTPHGSGVGNVVLEVSATPYLYSLRFYDWLRRDAEGKQRPVHVEHAFANLNRDRRGAAVRAELVQAPRVVEEGDGWRDELIGALPEMFFEVHRLVVEPGTVVAQATGGRFQVLNVVDGAGAVLRWAGGEHRLAYAETIVVPASVGDYEVIPIGAEPMRIVRAFVP